MNIYILKTTMDYKELIEAYEKYKGIYKWLDNLYICKVDNKVYKMKLIDIIIRYELNIHEVIAKTLILKDDYTYLINNTSVEIYCSIWINSIRKLQDVQEWSTFYIDNLWESWEYLYFNWIKSNTWQFTWPLNYWYWTEDSEVIKIGNTYYFIR